MFTQTTNQQASNFLHNDAKQGITTKRNESALNVAMEITKHAPHNVMHGKQVNKILGNNPTIVI